MKEARQVVVKDAIRIGDFLGVTLVIDRRNGHVTDHLVRKSIDFTRAENEVLTDKEFRNSDGYCGFVFGSCDGHGIEFRTVGCRGDVLLGRPACAGKV